MNKDADGCVINGEKTFEEIAHFLTTESAVALAWTDERSTEYAIIFAMPRTKLNRLPLGLHDAALFVSIARVGAWGFDLRDDELSPSYVAEKLGMHPESITTAKLAELLTGVRRALLRD